MGEKPSPSGEDFSSSIGMKKHTLPSIPSLDREGKFFQNTLSP
jgi:hypothetical protein